MKLRFREAWTAFRAKLSRGFGRNVALLVGSSALGQLAVVIALPIIGRLYSPADLGQLGAFVAFLGTVAVATGLRYDVMIVAGETEAEAAALLYGVCAVSVPLCLGFTFIFAGLIYSNSLGFGVLPLEAAYWMFPALVITQLFFTIRYWLMREGSFPLIARVTIGQNVARAIAPILFYPLAGSWVGLVAGEVVGRCTGVRGMLRAQGARLRAALEALGPGEVLRAFRRFPETVYAGLPSSLINSASNFLPLPLIAAVFGVNAAGYFGVVQRGMQLPAALVSRNVADVFHSRLAEQARSTSGDPRRVFWRTGAVLCLVGGAPSVLVAMVGPWLFRALLGERWDPASRLLVAMIPWTLAAFVVSPLSRAVVVFRGQVLKLWYDLASIAALGAVIVSAPRQHWSLEQTVWVLSLTQAATYGLYLVILVRLLPPRQTEPRVEAIP